ncbi:hypothetical protein PIB30_052142 [Stylosanthes scabra]|uniref:Ribonuclease H1 N-terminal domain-containing protein n=1 Tax=Stylosanthes scabra TaxID=79078 RepID=A0ABU6XFV2_9FABA|nr:hypothetical protein [Stylosanthes scabra]
MDNGTSKYYAMRKGRRIGIYTSWVVSNRQVNGYSNCQHRSFATYENAIPYMERGDKAFDGGEDEQPLMVRPIAAATTGGGDRALGVTWPVFKLEMLGAVQVSLGGKIATRLRFQKLGAGMVRLLLRTAESGHALQIDSPPTQVAQGVAGVLYKRFAKARSRGFSFQVLGFGFTTTTNENIMEDAIIGQQRQQFLQIMALLKEVEVVAITTLIIKTTLQQFMVVLLVVSPQPLVSNSSNQKPATDNDDKRWAL